MQKKDVVKAERGSFRGTIGFVLAAAGSAVGLGNIWRFPYLAARDGGGLFLVVYIVLALTFGFTLLITEISIGRKTKQSPLTAYMHISREWKWIGYFQCLVPFLILPYYSAIGGWVLKYFTAFLTGHGDDAAEDGYFGDFITGRTAPGIYMFIFLAICAVIIYMGVSGGIEKSSRIMMPVLVVLVIVVAVFSLTIKNDDPARGVVTGIDGLKVYVIPSLKGITLKRFLLIVMDALGQLFFSISVAMGIMIAYGSYMPDDSNLVKSVNQIEIFDTVIAFLAGVMIIPAVYVFMGPEGMNGGPSLMFVSLPKVFAQMGVLGNAVGTAFFAMVLFAAVTSAMSILEAVVSSLIDGFGMSRKKATVIESLIALVIGLVVCFGYNIFYFKVDLPNGTTGQILDILDYLTNNLLMPFTCIATCILIGWVVKPDTVIKEATRNGEHLGRKWLYIVMIKFIAPAFLLVLLLMSMGIIKLAD